MDMNLIIKQIETAREEVVGHHYDRRREAHPGPNDRWHHVRWDAVFADPPGHGRLLNADQCAKLGLCAKPGAESGDTIIWVSAHEDTHMPYNLIWQLDIGIRLKL